MRTDQATPAAQGYKRIAKVPLKGALLVINKLSNKTYKKLYPRYLAWLGVNISDKFSEYGDPWISPQCRFDAAGYNLITLGDGVTISYGTSILVHDYSIDKALYARRGMHGKFLKAVSIGRNCFIGANTMILPGTAIGDDCIIGGGSVVKGHFPDGSVVCGNPARVVGTIDEFLAKHEAKEDIIYGLS